MNEEQQRTRVVGQLILFQQLFHESNQGTPVELKAQRLLTARMPILTSADTSPIDWETAFTSLIRQVNLLLGLEGLHFAPAAAQAWVELGQYQHMHGFTMSLTVGRIFGSRS